MIGDGTVDRVVRRLERAEHPMFYEGASGVEIRVQIEGGDQRFDGVREQRFLLTPSRHFLAATEQQELAQLQILRDFVETGGAHQVRFEFGEAALRRRSVETHQAVAHYETQ